MWTRSRLTIVLVPCSVPWNQSIRKMLSEFKIQDAGAAAFQLLTSDHLGAHECPSIAVTLFMGKECLCLYSMLFNHSVCQCSVTVSSTFSTNDSEKAGGPGPGIGGSCPQLRLEDRHMTRLWTRPPNFH